MSKAEDQPIVISAAQFEASVSDVVRLQRKLHPEMGDDEADRTARENVRAIYQDCGFVVEGDDGDS